MTSGLCFASRLGAICSDCLGNQRNAFNCTQVGISVCRDFVGRGVSFDYMGASARSGQHGDYAGSDDDGTGQRQYLGVG